MFGGAGDDFISDFSGNNLLEGGDGNDRLIGGIGDDVLDGGAGDDYLGGQYGNNTYRFGRGYGHDIIQTTAADVWYPTTTHTVQFLAGIAPTDIIVTRVDGNLQLSVRNTTDQLLIAGRGGPIS